MNAPARSARPLVVPVVLGTVREGRVSERVARYVHRLVAGRDGVESELVDIRDLRIPAGDEGEQAKDPTFSALATRADAFVLVVPEYNRGYPGSLKHALDSNLQEYVHKAVGVCGVSAGGFGGTRVIEALLPVLRELGLVTIFWDGHFSRAQELLDDDGVPLPGAKVPSLDRFLGELEWMATTLRHGREHVTVA